MLHNIRLTQYSISTPSVHNNLKVHKRYAIAIGDTPYRIVYIGFVILGAMRPLDDVINFCDALNGLMAIPNLIALIVLAPIVGKSVNDYFNRLKTQAISESLKG